MPLDATPGGASADSYLTVDEADALAAQDIGPEADKWLAAATTEAMKEAALRRATRDLNAYLRTGWRPYSSAQALPFPRSIDVNAGGPYITRDLRMATYEQATYVLSNAPILDKAAARQARQLASVSEPNTAYTQSQDTDPAAYVSPAALHYLEGFAHVGTRRGVRSVRMAGGFVP